MNVCEPCQDTWPEFFSPAMVPSSNLIRAMRGPRSGFVAGWNELGALTCGAGCGAGGSV
jgi:hypothetical protein